MDLHEANVSAHQLWRNAVVERGVVSLDECDGLSHTCVPNGTCVDGHEAGERFGGNGTPRATHHVTNSCHARSVHGDSRPSG